MATGSHGPRFIYLSVIVGSSGYGGRLTSKARVRSKDIMVYYNKDGYTLVMSPAGAKLTVTETPEQIDALLSTLLPKWRKKK